MNVAIVKEGMWQERSMEDVAHPARILVAGTIRSRVRAKLEAPNQMEAPAVNVCGC